MQNIKERIGLVIPPSCFLASAKVFVSLGILKVAACLEKAGYPVSVLDLNGISNYLEVTEKFCQDTDAKIFGLTVVTPQFKYAREIVNVIKRVIPDSRIIGGGPHITSCCSAYKREVKLGILGRAHRSYRQIMETFDIAVAGDGEEAIFLAIQPGASGLIDADDPDNETLFLQEEKLGEYPYPNRALIDVLSYRYEIDGVNAASYVGQLGCSFGCIFCNGRMSPSFRRVRTRPSESLKAELRHLHETYGFKAFLDYSDEVNLYKTLFDDLHMLMDLQGELGVGFKFRAFIKANLFTREQAKAFKEANFVELCVGAESGDDRILRNIEKKSTVAQNTKVVELCHEFGIRIKTFCSLGHPGESEASIEATANWLKKVKPDDFDATCVVAFGGTPIFDLSVPHPDLKDVWVYEAKHTKDKLYSHDIDFGSDTSFYKGIPSEYVATVFTDYLTAERLAKLRDDLEADVRSTLNIPYYQVTPASVYDRSMGVLDPGILRHST